MTSEPQEKKLAPVKPLFIEKEMKEAYLNYAMSVIYSRALPDVRDGLKPSQRRILVAMNDLHLGPRAKYRKCAKIAGDTSGNYHPHGEGVIYPTLVRLAQDFNMRYPLVDGQGNFGSIDGDPPAAMRYTEARMAEPAMDMLEDLDKETVDFVPNYDETRMQPVVLPSKFPNLLCNGSSGIAVGMATNLPPHNLGEIASALAALIDNPEITIEELLEHVHGPDFPTGGIILGKAEIRKAYYTGRGHLNVRARTEVVERGNRLEIVVTEIPYQVGKDRITEKVKDAVKDGRIDTIADIRDESSSRVGMRLIFELKRGVDDAQVTLNRLFKYTPLQETFTIQNLAIDRGRPRLLNLKQLLEAFRDHRVEVIRRRTRFLLRKAEERLHIVEGLRIAVANIDEVVAIIKGSPDVESARTRLMERFQLTEIQARAILDMRLARLTSLEIEKLEAEWRELKEKIAHYRAILADVRLVHDIIKADLADMVKRYGDKRRTEIIEQEGEGLFLDEDLIPVEAMAVTVSKNGYIKRTPLEAYRRQGRGGKGVTGADTKEGDFLQHLFVASTHDYLLFFSDQGKVYWKKVYELPVLARNARGRAMANVLEFQSPEERVTSILPVSEFLPGRYVFMATRQGVVKRTELEAFSRPKRKGIIALTLDPGDHLIGAALVGDEEEVILGTAEGYAVRFPCRDVRPMGRPARGVRGITLRPGDEVVDLVIPKENTTLFTICEEGYGKRTRFSEYRVTRRGGKGIINIRTTKRNGRVVNLLAVSEEDEVMILTTKGMTVRIPVKGISLIGRDTQGVRCMRLAPGDKVVSASRVVPEEAEEETSGAGETGSDPPSSPPQGDPPRAPEEEDNDEP